MKELKDVLFELLALSILSGLARLFLLERTIIGGMKQFFGGMVFGVLIGYLLQGIAPDQLYYPVTGKVWRVWAAGCAIFGREILHLLKVGIKQAGPMITNYFIKQGKKIAAGYSAYKKFKDENDI